MCQILGLRYAPEIRFYRDNTINLYEEQRKQALQYLEDIKKEKLNSPEMKMIITLKNLQDIRSMTQYNYEL